MEKQKLPNATAVLVLGILSFLTFCCYGIFGIVFGLVGYLMSRSDSKRLQENPGEYGNQNVHTVGKILSLIGLILGVLTLIFFIWIIMKIGPENMQDEEMVRRRVEELFGKR
jgi:H+/Cl- antiporter ClcA